MIFENSEKLNRYLSEDLGIKKVLLSFSLGKDSIGAWIEMRRYYDEIVPFYLYLVPGLEFVEESIAYYEKVFGTHIIQLPQPSLYGMMSNLVFSSPPIGDLYLNSDIPSFTYEDLRTLLAEALDWNPGSTWYATGVRANDSLNRWGAIKRFGAIYEKTHKFFPIYDWNKKRLYDEIKASGIKLPVDYRMFGRSFDGIDYRFLVKIKKYYPRDYEKILTLFPFADMEIYRREKFGHENVQRKA